MNYKIILKSSKILLWGCCFLFVFVLLFLAVIVFPQIQYYKSTNPPDYIIFSEIDSSHYLLTKQNDTYFAVIPKNWDKTIWFHLALPSGSPIYVYEKNTNKLIDWTIDSGDDPKFLDKWKMLWDGT